MTSAERSALDQLYEFVRDWRDESLAWQDKMDERLRGVEGYVQGRQAVDRTGDQDTANHRATLGLAIAFLTMLTLVGQAVLPRLLG